MRELNAELDRMMFEQFDHRIDYECDGWNREKYLAAGMNNSAKPIKIMCLKKHGFN